MEPALRLVIRDRPPTANSLFRLQPVARGRVVHEWREAAGWQAMAAPRVRLEEATVTIKSYLTTRRKRDPAAEIVCGKAAIDGLVDAGVLPDDDKEHLHEITYRQPTLDWHFDAMLLVVYDATGWQEDLEPPQ